MSNNIYGCNGMTVTAFVGGHSGKSVQITIGEEYTKLTETEVLELIHALTSRLLCLPGYSATD